MTRTMLSVVLLGFLLAQAAQAQDDQTAAALVAVFDSAKRTLPAGAVALAVRQPTMHSAIQIAASRTNTPVAPIENVMRCSLENVVGKRREMCRLVGVVGIFEVHSVRSDQSSVTVLLRLTQNFTSPKHGYTWAASEVISATAERINGRWSITRFKSIAQS